MYSQLFKKWFLSLVLVLAGSQAALADSRELYNETVRSVAWIVNFDENASGTGVVVDTDRQLLFTAAHVVGASDIVAVIFPDIDRDGNVISDHDHYVSESNIRARMEDGLLVFGQVIARDRAKDLAIIQVNSLPSGATSIPIASELPTEGTRLHMIGHPAERPLWNYSLLETSSTICTSWTWGGSNQTVEACIVTVLGDVWNGNSGGPIFNDDGEIVGIVSAGPDTGLREDFAIDSDEMRKFSETLTDYRGIKITNTTDAVISYSFRWNPDDDWQHVSLQPGETKSHSIPAHVRVQPEINYDYSFVEEYQEVQFPLDSQVTLRGGDMSVGGGLSYEFRYHGNTSIRIANADKE